MLNPEVRCDVYRNLNKPPITYSLRQRGLVVGYTGEVVLQDCTFKHATPEQIARCQLRRTVYQWVKGYVTSLLPEGEWVRLICDPKKVHGFCVAETGERLDRAAYVRLCQAGCFAVLEEAP